MGTVNFYLKEPAPASGRSLIYLKYKYNGKVLVYSFGQNIKPTNWNHQLKKVKSNKETTADGKYSLNDLLDNLKRVCLQAYNQESRTGIPQPETLRKHLDNFLHQNEEGDPDRPSLMKLIERFQNNEIKHKGQDKSKNTIKTYNTCLGHLVEFEERAGTKVDFETVTLDFYYRYVSFLKKKGLSVNAIAKDIQILKVFMGEAVDLGYTANLDYRHKKFAVNRQETDSVFLSQAEVIALYKVPLADNKRLEQVRDLFVFGCSVGLRFSDFSTLGPENIVMIDGVQMIKTITHKTGDLVVIPCNPLVLRIFEKYKHAHNRLPKAPSNQKFNDYIKEVCKLAGLTEKGRLATDPQKELWECISSHTARRSFATNLYLQKFPTIGLMRITGHRTERAFLKYIKVTKLATALQMNEHNQQQDWNFLTKVA